MLDFFMNLKGVWGFTRARLICSDFFATDTMVEGARMIHTEMKSLLLDCLMFSGGFFGRFWRFVWCMGVEEVRKNTHRSDESLCNT
jgi:hypothetical protein